MLKRKFFGINYTIGDLYVNGVFFCNVIEDTLRSLPGSCPYTSRNVSCRCKGKVYAKTAIPAGEYRVTMEYSPKFKRVLPRRSHLYDINALQGPKFKRVLPRLHDVPHFSGILVHPGNTQEDSAGCLICGKNTVKGRVTDSRATCDKLNAILSEEKDIVIRIINGKEETGCAGQP